MRNFMLFLFIGIFCLSVFLFADGMDELQRGLVAAEQEVALGDIREFHDQFKSDWSAFKSELAAIKADLNANKIDLETAKKRLADVNLALAKLKIKKAIGVIILGYQNPQVSRVEAGAAAAKIKKMETELDAADTVFKVSRVMIQLVGLVKKAHISVGQFSILAYIEAMEKGNAQLMDWWKKNQKSTTGLEKLVAIQEKLAALKGTVKSADKNGLISLKAQLDEWDLETLLVFSEN